MPLPNLCHELVILREMRVDSQTGEEEVESDDYEEKGGEAIGIVGGEQAH